MISRLLWWCAWTLGVSEPRCLNQWLLRLLILPPIAPSKSPPPFDPAKAPDLLGWAATCLGVTQPTNPKLWLLRLFWLPPALSAQPAAIIELAHQLATWTHRLRQAITWLLSPLPWLWRKVSPYLPQIDYAALGERSDRAAGLPIFLSPAMRLALLGGAFCVIAVIVCTPFDWQGQLIFFLLTWCAALWVRHVPGQFVTLLLISISLIATLRYAAWRSVETLHPISSLEWGLGAGLLLAEIYTWVVLILGYIQTAWPLQRPPVPLPADPRRWPTVDIYIPTYNEPLKVVKPTVLAAIGLDWPKDKINIYILDDGKRAEFREFAEEAGIHYMIRPNNSHAKAGNLNHALAKTKGEFIAIFDCDHLPARSFLQLTLGWFLQDPQCAMLQTPHHFFSPDPFERNLNTFRRIPNEGALFYGLVQAGNDFWNATFFCGSCAVLRRGPLQEVGGIAVETVTEDAHTALKMHRLGYNTAYLNIIQAAGLATESLSGHVGQRIRWARGMAQIFRIDNPLFGRGLSLFQRLCYSNAMLHFFYGLPRLVFLTAPLAYLYAEAHIIQASSALIAVYVLPHIVLANLANSRLQGNYRHSFWAEVYESVLAWYIALPTTVALINPKLGKFNVTAKGGLIEQEYFDSAISKPYLTLVALNLVGLVIGVIRLFYWNTDEMGTVLLNLIWTVYNLLILGCAVGVATETRQMRSTHRVITRMTAGLYLPGGFAQQCEILDFSLGGMGIRFDPSVELKLHDRVQIALRHGDQELVVPARIASLRGDVMGVQLEPLSLEQEAQYVQCTFARADAWVDWMKDKQADHPMQGLREIVTLGVHGYVSLFESLSHMLPSRQLLNRLLPTFSKRGRRQKSAGLPN